MKQHLSEPRTALSHDPSCVCAWWPDEPHGWIVNFSKHPITVAGRIWPTVEHFYHCQKYPNEPQIIEKILSVEDPNKAKQVANEPKNRALARKDWDSIKDGVMLLGIRAKAEQHSDIALKLLETGTRRIVEDSPDDSYWGCGKDGLGKNRLGELWQVVREELRKKLS